MTEHNKNHKYHNEEVNVVDEVSDDDVEGVVTPGEEEEHDGGQGVEERQPVEDEEGGWSVLFRD